MNKLIPAIAVPIAAIVIGFAVFGLAPEGCEPNCDDGGKHHDAVWSGPISVTQYKHRLGDNVFFIITGLQPDEKGTIGVFTPEGVLYKTIHYDGSLKSSFNQFFFPDTTATLDICKPEQLVGEWKVVFADNSYPPLIFEMTDEYLPDSEHLVVEEC